MDVIEIIQDDIHLNSLAPSSSSVMEVMHFRQWILNWITLTELLQQHTSPTGKCLDRLLVLLFFHGVVGIHVYGALVLVLVLLVLLLSLLSKRHSLPLCR